MTAAPATRPGAQPLPQTGAGRLWRFMRAKALWWRACGWTARIARALGVSPVTLEALLEEVPR